MVKYIIRFIILVLVQVFILNNIQFSRYVNPYLYILFIITLPLTVSRMQTMLAAFLLGITIDIFSNSIGIHAFSCVLIAFLRIFILQLYQEIDMHRLVNNLDSCSLGREVFIKYAATMTLVHHIALFTLDTFSLHNFWFLFLRILYSFIFTMLLILGLELFKKNKR